MQIHRRAKLGPAGRRAVELGGEHYALALAACEGLTHDLLGLAARVDIGGVDEVDPSVERPVDDPDRGIVVRLAPGADIIAPRHSWLT